MPPTNYRFDTVLSLEIVKKFGELDVYSWPKLVEQSTQVTKKIQEEKLMLVGLAGVRNTHLFSRDVQLEQLALGAKAMNRDGVVFEDATTTRPLEKVLEAAHRAGALIHHFAVANEALCHHSWANAAKNSAN